MPHANKPRSIEPRDRINGATADCLLQNKTRNAFIAGANVKCTYNLKIIVRQRISLMAEWMNHELRKCVQRYEAVNFAVQLGRQKFVANCAAKSRSFTKHIFFCFWTNLPRLGLAKCRFACENLRANVVA